jgi:hypothetical protein
VADAAACPRAVSLGPLVWLAGVTLALERCELPVESRITAAMLAQITSAVTISTESLLGRTRTRTAV